VQFEPAELAGALRAAGRGQLSSQALAEAVLSCFRFDPAARARRAQIEIYLRTGSLAILLLLGSSVVLLLVWERRRRGS
jgi:hypothetical protein